MYLNIDELVDILYINFIIIFVMDKRIVEWFLINVYFCNSYKYIYEWFCLRNVYVR